jgi:hypothetical protein
VELGTSNDKLVEIKKGLEENEEVALSPLSLMSEEEKNRLFGAGSKSATAKDWSKTDVEQSKGASKAADAAKGEGKAEKKATKKGGFGGAGMPAWVSKFRNIAPEDRAKLKSASEEERSEILKKAGFTDDELNQMKEMGAGGGFGGGPGGGGFGGGPGGGGPRP